jgi:eukaryotic-like serine/threonine-protein kinase
VTLAENIGGLPSRQLTVNPYYMDETLVTNHQYVEFLNHHLSQLEVERGVVRMDDEIWLMLGEVYEGYEPIVFKNGEFKITNAIYTLLPVLRVTAYGAAAYARFYNRRLPTYTEWLYALDSDSLRQPKPAPESADSSDEMNMEAMHSQMQVQAQSKEPASKMPPPSLEPVMNEPPNQYEIRGLDERIKEWGRWIFEPSARDKITDAEFVILPEAIVRQPWEAFADVGFRCVREVNYKGGN